MSRSSSLTKWGVVMLLLASLSSCEDILEQYFPKHNPTTPTFPSLGQDIPFYTLSGGTRLDGYSTANAATRTSSVAITGLGTGETLLAIDFRPATGQLYGVSSASRLYVINQNTGAARPIGSGAFSPAVAGNLVGFDFNPTVDRIRLVTSTGQNLRINPETGTVAATDGAINGAAGAMLTGAAYTNNVAGAETTALYAINSQNQQLYLVNPPNNGTLVSVGALNLNVSGDGGFDIDAKTGTALGLYAVNGKPTLFAVNLATGAARSLAQYATNLNYSSIAIPTRPVAYAVGSITLGGRSTSNVLHIFDPTDTSDPGARVTKSFLGLARNEAILGMDFRPATGQLYALVLGNGGPFVDGSDFPASTRLYTINPATAEVTRVADVSIPLDFGTFGLMHAFDFNPVTDEIRIVSPTGQNLRVNPTTGAGTAESAINPVSTTVRAVAYTNSLVPATSTSLYAIGAEASSPTRKLYLINPPASSTVSEIGVLDVSGLPKISPASTVQMSTFDIGGTTNTAYGIASLGSTSDFGIVRINLSSGSITLARQLTVNGGPSITALAVGLGF